MNIISVNKFLRKVMVDAIVEMLTQHYFNQLKHRLSSAYLSFSSLVPLITHKYISYMPKAVHKSSVKIGYFGAFLAQLIDRTVEERQ